MSDYASAVAIVTSAMGAWKPPPKLSLSEWADEHFYLSPESSAESGRWRTLPYQRGIMDAITDPTVERVSVMKSARVGWTKIGNAAIGYHIDQDPCSILVVQPTVDDAKGYSKEELAPMFRDCPRLAKIVYEDREDSGPRGAGNAVQHKTYPGGVLSLVGANSGNGLRRVSRRVVFFDEVDGYPPSAGSDGDPIELGIKRTEYFHNRKILAGSTPLVAGASRIEALFEQGDQRRYYVPCPHCGHMAPLVFRGEHGHRLEWPEDRPEDAFFSCQGNGCVIEHKDKRAMVEAGEWRAARGPTEQEIKRGLRHVSFHIWAAYSYSPNADWGVLASEFVKAKANPETLRTFINTVLGETWQEQGDAPDWERLYHRREQYELGAAPSPVLAVTAGVDVQKDRFVYEVVGWGPGKESWSIDAGVIPADTANDGEWLKLDDLLNRDFGGLSIRMLAVDSGFRTNTAYNWARRHPMSRVIAVKGMATARMLVGSPTPVDVSVNGKRIARGYKVFPVGVDVAKSELYGWLKLPRPEEGQPFPPGWCHFPEYGEDFFKQLTAEHLVSKQNARGFTVHEWQVQPGRENHWLDCRVYARAAAALLGLDRMRTPARPAAPPPTREEVLERVRPKPAAPVAAPPPRPPRKGSGFLSGARGPGRTRGKGWLR